MQATSINQSIVFTADGFAGEVDDWSSQICLSLSGEVAEQVLAEAESSTRIT